MDTANAATAGLREAVQGYEGQLGPLLLSQGLDVYYIKSGLEFTAYENFVSARDNKEAAQHVLNEAEEEMPDLFDAYDEAQWNLNRANSREEYEHFLEIFNDIEARYNSLSEKERIAREAFEQLDADLPGLKEQFEQARTQRIETAAYIKENANVCVEEYRPKDGPPAYPEVPEDATSTCRRTQVDW